MGFNSAFKGLNGYLMYYTLHVWTFYGLHHKGIISTISINDTVRSYSLQ